MAAEERGRKEIDAAISDLEELVAERTIGSIGYGIEIAEQRVSELEGVADALSEAVAERDIEIERLRAENAELRERNAAIYEELADAAEEVEQVRAEARGQATKIRMQALRHAVRFADPRSRAEPAAAAAEPEPAPPPEGGGEFAHSPAGVPPGSLLVELGPLEDFEQLLGAERALGSIPGVASVTVRRFSKGRASLLIEADHRLDAEPVLAALAGAAPRLRTTTQTQIVIDLEASSLGSDVA